MSELTGLEAEIHDLKRRRTDLIRDKVTFLLKFLISTLNMLSVHVCRGVFSPQCVRLGSHSLGALQTFVYLLNGSVLWIRLALGWELKSEPQIRNEGR